MTTSQFHAGPGLDAAKAFTVLAIVELLTGQLILVLSAFPSMVSSLGNFARLQAYIELPEVAGKRLGGAPVDTILSNDTASLLHNNPDGHHYRGTRSQGDFVFDTEGATFKYPSAQAEVLRNLSLRVPDAQTTVVLGTVGSGKSSLLRACLGEIFHVRGNVVIRPCPVAYCAQEPWLVHGSIRKNIIAEMPFDARWYATVIHCCALEEDLSSLNGGDAFEVGSKGLALSGGQRQRIVSFFMLL